MNFASAILFLSLALVFLHVDECMAEECRDYDGSDDGMACGANYDPVCASNGKTYSNECRMCADQWERQKAGEKVKLTVDHKGKC